MLTDINLPLLLLIITVLGNLLLAFLVLFKNPRRRINQIFFTFIFMVSVWVTASFLADEPLGTFWQEVLIRADLFSGALAAYLFLLFASNFPQRQRFPNNLSL